MSIRKNGMMVVAAFAFLGVAYSQELLVNPGFELDAAGNAPPQSWGSIGGDRVKDATGGLDGIAPRTGLTMWQIQGTGGNGASISQVVNLAEGDYLLSTWYAVRAVFSATDYTFSLSDSSGVLVSPASATNPDLAGGEFVELTRSYQGLAAGDYTISFEISGSGLRQGTLDDFSLEASTAVVDSDPPLPNPMSWEVIPTAISDTTIEMTATTASDPSGVEYFFTNTTIVDGSHDSGWQSSASYSDIGLEPSTEYSYTVKARDLSLAQNETAASLVESATTSEASANLLGNGGFEVDADLASPPAGWTLVGGDAVKTTESGLDGIAPIEGAKMFQLQGGGGSGASISQAVVLGGGSYSLSAYYSQRVNEGFAPTELSFALFDSAGFEVASILSVDPDPIGGDWVLFSRSYVALAAGTYSVVFEIAGPNLRQALVDDFILQAGGQDGDPIIRSFTSVGAGLWDVELEGASSTQYEFRSSPDLIFAPGALIENLTQGGGADAAVISGDANAVVTTNSEGRATVRMSLPLGSVGFIRAQITNLP